MPKHLGSVFSSACFSSDAMACFLRQAMAFMQQACRVVLVRPRPRVECALHARVRHGDVRIILNVRPIVLRESMRL